MCPWEFTRPQPYSQLLFTTSNIKFSGVTTPLRSARTELSQGRGREKGGNWKPSCGCLCVYPLLAFPHARRGISGNCQRSLPLWASTRISKCPMITCYLRTSYSNVFAFATIQDLVGVLDLLSLIRSCTRRYHKFWDISACWSEGASRRRDQGSLKHPS